MPKGGESPFIGSAGRRHRPSGFGMIHRRTDWAVVSTDPAFAAGNGEAKDAAARPLVGRRSGRTRVGTIHGVDVRLGDLVGVDRVVHAKCGGM